MSLHQDLNQKQKVEYMRWDVVTTPSFSSAFWVWKRNKKDREERLEIREKREKERREREERERKRKERQTLSPRIEPPVLELEGSMAKTAILKPRFAKKRPKISIKDDFPTPGGL